MIIERISIKSFGMLTDVTLDFSDGINVIVGRNEAGKSTIAAFIKYMLYGFVNENKTDGPDERARRVNWENGTAQGSMTVRVGSKRYTLNRVTERVENGQRVSYKEDCSIIDLETGSPAFGKMPAGEVFFGVDRELFENTAFVGQIGDSSIDGTAVKESIENILFSGSEKINNQRAASRIAVKMDTLLHKGGTGGTIYELGRRSEQLSEKFKSADEDNKQILAMEAKLHEIRTQRKTESELLDKLRDLDVCYRNVIIIKTFDKLHELEKLCDDKTEEYNSFILENTRADFVPTESYLDEISMTRTDVDDAYRALIDASDRYDAEKSAIGITKDTEAQIELSDSFGGEAEVISGARLHKGRIIRNAAFGIASLLLAIAAVVFILASSLHIAVDISVGVAGGLALLFAGYTAFSAFRSRRRLLDLANGFGTENITDLMAKLAVIAEDRAKRDKMIADTEDARLAYEDAKENYEQRKAALLDAILRWGEEPPTSNLNEFLDSLERRVRDFLDAERVILNEKGELENSMRETRRELADKSEIDIRAQVSPLKRKVLDQIDHEQIVTGIGECERKIAELEQSAEALENELALLKLRATDPGELYAKMQENDARIAELRRQHAAMSVALTAIENASGNLREEISPRLGEFSAELMSVMTDKKYSDIDVSDGLKVSFVTPSGEKRSVDFLSGGTRDLTYISLRMALIDMLYTEKPPTLFDESFAHQDNARARSMMKAIKRLSEDGQQSFIFTCREREAGLAKELLPKTSVFKLSPTDDATL